MAAFNNQLCRQSSSTVPWATLAAILQGSHCWFWACWGFFCYIGDKKTSSKQWVTAWNKFSHESRVESREARVSRFNSNYRLEKVMEEKCWLFWTVTAFQENHKSKCQKWTMAWGQIRGGSLRRFLTSDWHWRKVEGLFLRPFCSNLQKV